ncbi:unnamed protein product, partial [Laminaria digitata]
MLISRGCPMMRVYRLKGGPGGYRGHVVNLAQDVGEIAKRLPRAAGDLPILVVRREGGEGTHKDLFVRRHKVLSALTWLQANNPFYRDIEIDAAAVDALPCDGQLRNIPECDEKSFLRSIIGNGMQEEAVINQLLQKMLRRQTGQNRGGTGSGARNAPVPWPDMEDCPLNEFKTQGLCTLCFPALFPYGKGDPTDVARRNKVTNAEAFKHLMRYYDGPGRGEYLRFATHPRFGHWAQNMLERHRLLCQANVYIKHHEGDAALTVGDVKGMLRNGGAEASALVQRMLRYAANITGSNAYWYARRQELQATFATKGCATVFITLSAADNHWEDLHRLMPPRYPDTTAGRRQAVIDNPHIVDWYFGHRVDTLFKSLPDGVLEAEWRWFRFEYQGRGSIHLHGTVKLKNDPGLVALTATVYKGHCAEADLARREEEVLAEFDDLEGKIEAGRAANAKICRYADWLVSTVNTRTSAEQEAAEGGVPGPHPSSVNPLKDGPFPDDTAATADFDAVINCVQRHKCRPEGYCKKKVRPGGGAPAVFKCRFVYPFPQCEETRLEFVELPHGKVKANLVTKRNDGNMNTYNRVLSQHWRGNIDIQLLLDWEDAVRYMVKHVDKHEKRSKPVLDLFRSAMGQENSGMDSACSKLRSVFLKAVGERDISAQETSRLLMSGKFSCSTFTCKRLNVDPDQQSRLVRMGQGPQGSGGDGQPQRALGMTALDRYATRATASANDHPEIMDMSAFEFTRCFKLSRGELQRETKPHGIVVIKLPAIGAKKGSNKYPLRCRNNLVAHRPWSGQISDAWRNQDWEEEPDDHEAE